MCGGDATDGGGCIGAVCIADPSWFIGCGLPRVGVAKFWTSAIVPAVMRLPRLSRRAESSREDASGERTTCAARATRTRPSPGLRKARRRLVLGPKDAQLLEGSPEKGVQPDCAREVLYRCARAVCPPADEPHQVMARRAAHDLQGMWTSLWASLERSRSWRAAVVWGRLSAKRTSVLSTSGQTAASASE